MSVVHEAIQNGVRQGVVADGGVPLIGGKLADNQRGAVVIAVVHDFHQIVTGRRFEGFQAPVVQDQQAGLGQLL